MTNGQIIRDIFQSVFVVIGMIAIVVGLLAPYELVWQAGVGIVVIYTASLVTRLVDRVGA